MLRFSTGVKSFCGITPEMSEAENEVECEKDRNKEKGRDEKGAKECKCEKVAV